MSHELTCLLGIFPSNAIETSEMGQIDLPGTVKDRIEFASDFDSLAVIDVGFLEYEDPLVSRGQGLALLCVQENRQLAEALAADEPVLVHSMSWGHVILADDDGGAEEIGAVLALLRIGLGGKGFPPEGIEWVEIDLAFDPVADIDALNHLAREVRLGFTVSSQASAEDTNWFTIETTELADLLDELGLLVPGPEWRRLHPSA